MHGTPHIVVQCCCVPSGQCTAVVQHAVTDQSGESAMVWVSSITRRGAPVVGAAAATASVRAGACRPCSSVIATTTVAGRLRQLKQTRHDHEDNHQATATLSQQQRRKLCKCGVASLYLLLLLLCLLYTAGEVVLVLKILHTAFRFSSTAVYSSTRSTGGLAVFLLLLSLGTTHGLSLRYFDFVLL